MKKQTALASWSGGKDSCLACYKALKAGYRIKRLVNFISREFKRCCFHGIESSLIRLQADAIGIPLFQAEVSPDRMQYEKEFKKAVSSQRQNDTKTMIFGDIYLDEHKDWVERVCKEIGITPIEPLWSQSPEKLIHEFIDLGFKARIVSCQADSLDQSFIGRWIDRDVVSEMKSMGICPCGENGEFHTLVVDGPLFKKKIDLVETEPVLKEGFWKYWFLDIKQFRCIPKHNKKEKEK